MKKMVDSTYNAELYSVLVVELPCVWYIGGYVWCNVTLRLYSRRKCHNNDEEEK